MRFTIIDPKTNEPIAGLAGVEITNASLMRLSPPKPFSDFALMEKVACAGMMRDSYYVIRVE